MDDIQKRADDKAWDEKRNRRISDDYVPRLFADARDSVSSSGEILLGCLKAKF